MKSCLWQVIAAFVVYRKREEMKTYQVIIQDEWNNLYHMGFYDKLEDSLTNVNNFLAAYDVEIEELTEYPSTFCWCFDKKVYVDEWTCVYIRGFIHDWGDKP